MLKTKKNIREFKVHNFGTYKEKIALKNVIENQIRFYLDYFKVPFEEQYSKIIIDENTNIEDIYENSFHKTLKEIFPISTSTGNVVLEYVGYILDRPLNLEDECRDKLLTYSRPLRLKLRITFMDVDEITGETHPIKSKEEEVFLMNFPMVTKRGTFIVNGAERIVVAQLHRSPGITFTEQEGILDINGQKLFNATIIPYFGSWLEFTLDNQRDLFALIDRKKKVSGLTFLRAMGLSVPEVFKEFYEIKKVKVSEIKKIKSEFIILADDIISKDGDVLASAGDNLNDIDLVIPKEIKEVNIIEPDSIDQVTIINSIKKDPTRNKDEARKLIYKKVKQGYSYSKPMADNFFENLYYNKNKYSFSYVGRYQVNKRLNLKGIVPDNTLTLTKYDVVGTIKELLQLRGELDITDDIDNLSNRRVRMPHEQMDQVIRSALIKLSDKIRERLSTSDIESKGIIDIFYSRNIENAVNDFFARSQLSQFMDEINPLATITHQRRLSALGPGGLNRKRAGFKVRDIHPTHFGRICPIETPEGPNIGLITHLSSYAIVDKKGFIETPAARVINRVITDEIVYMTADESEKYIIASADVRVDKNNKILDDYVYCHLKYDVAYKKSDEVEFIDVSPKQMVSVSASLIPFLEHDDANRALMGVNMQRQSTPLLYTEEPIVGSGIEHLLASNSNSAIVSEYDGKIEYVDSHRIVLKLDKPKYGEETVEYFIQKFRRSNQDTSKNQRPIVKIGQKIKKGDFLTDGMSISNSNLALGKNLKVAFMPWYGYNFEDAIILSERLVKEDVLTSVHIVKAEIEARVTKLGKEEITVDIPNLAPEKFKNIDENGIIRLGAKVKSGDLLVGKITPQSETEQSGEDKLLQIIFGRKATNVKNTSLYANNKTYGTVIDVRIFSRKKVENDDKSKRENLLKLEILEKEIRREIYRSELAYNEKVFKLIKGKKLGKNLKVGNGTVKKDTVIDKKLYRTLLGNKISIIDLFMDDIMLTQELSVLKDKFSMIQTKIQDDYDKEKNAILKSDDLPSGVVKRVVVYLAQVRKITVGDKIAGRHGNKGVISKIAPIEDMPMLPDGSEVDVILNPLGVPSRMNIGQIYETLLGLVGEQLNTRFLTPVFDGAKEQDLKDYFKQINLPSYGKIFLRNGITGDYFDQPVTVGVMYMMKLNHLAVDKVHARATGPYSLVTQQPLGGKAQNGGQRLGEMEVWALEAYGAAYTLQEMLTIKSDDVIGRNKAHESIIKGKFPIATNPPESFNVLLKEMKALGFNVIEEKDEKHFGKRIKSLTIKIASYEDMVQWATRKNDYVGKVTKADTINYKTFKPEKGGLFCERIFGPIKDWTCACGKYKGRKYAGQVCEKCGVEVTEKKARRRYMGIIELATPVANILYFHGQTGNFVAPILGMKSKDIESVLYYESYLIKKVNDPKIKVVSQWDMINEIQYRKLLLEFGEECIEVTSGAAAIYDKLKSINLDEKIAELKKEVESIKNEKKVQTSKLKSLRVLKILTNMKKNGIRPEWIIWKAIPVLPPDLRPLVPLESSKFASADLNDLYRRVINRNNRLYKFLEDDVPEVILKNEKRMLQESVDILIDNGKRGRAITGSNGSPLKSLCETLRSKQGRFRQNLLGKRVDFSGRAVIVINPNLKISECGIPLKIGRELFKTFIEREKNKLNKLNNTDKMKPAEKLDEAVIEKMIENEYDKNLVLLNRAPTLHRMSIQAFKPKLTQGYAIQLHPLACAAFNADFDGDQMGVHLPLTPMAQMESRLLLWSINNILSPSHGDPIVIPSQDMILGLYYLTSEKPYTDENSRKYYSVNDVYYEYERMLIDVNDPAKRRMIFTPIKLLVDGKFIDTTVGRAIFNFGLNKKLPYFNKTITKKNIKQMIRESYDILTRDEMIVYLDYLKATGYFFSTRAGITFGLWDIIIPKEKYKKIEDAQQQVNKLNEQYKNHAMTNVERYKTIINIWTSVDESLKHIMSQKMEKGNPKDKATHFNPIFIMLDSGARGSQTQIKQLASLRGLMENPSGDIIEIPIKSNFMEGLKVAEFFISAHGARKGLADTALKTSESGYLTRRLVDVSHDIIVKEHDCGTTLGIEVQALDNPPYVKESLSSRIYGRVAFEDVIAKTGEKLVGQNEIITREIASKIENAGILSVKVRSPLTCQTKKGICQLCYGLDLSKKALVELGTPVGIIAAQSIGEPGTQLTMRTFHIGGVTSKKSEDEYISAELLLLQKGSYYKKYEIENKLVNADFKAVKDVKNNKEYKFSGYKLEIRTPNYAGRKITVIFNENGSVIKINNDKKKEYEEVSLIYGKLKYRLQYNKEPNSEGKHLNLSRDGELVILSDIKDEVVVNRETQGNDIVYKTAAEDIKNPETGALICPAGHIIDSNRLASIMKSKLAKIWIFRELERYAIPFGSELLVPNRTLLKKKTKIAKKTLYFDPIIAENTGKVIFKDINFSPDTKDKADKVVIQPAVIKLNSKTQPKILIDGKEHQIEISQIVRGVGKGEKEIHTTHINVKEGQMVQRGDILGKIVIQKSERTDITGGLMKVEELFEARHRKSTENAILSEISGTVELSIDKTKKVRGNYPRLIRVVEPTGGKKEYKYNQRTQQIKVKEGDRVEQGDPLTSGIKNLFDLLRIKGADFVRRYIVDEVKSVYKLQGIDIHDKHIEIIVSKMLSKVKITKMGDSIFYPGQIVDKTAFQEEIARISKEGGIRPESEQTLLGISKVAIETDSWLSAASFQETIKVLSLAALEGKKDTIDGLKENIIIGNLIPAGTGFVSDKDAVGKNLDQLRELIKHFAFKDSKEI